MAGAQQHSLMELINPFPRQWEFLEATANYDYTLYGGAAGGGKLLPLDTLLPCPSGYVMMGDIAVGDQLFDEQGLICRVSKVFDIVQSPVLYRLTFDDGSAVDCCKDHQWLTFNAKELGQLTRLDPEWRRRRRGRRKSRSAVGSGHRKEHTPEHRRFLSEACTARNQAKKWDYQPPPTGSIRTTQEIVDTIFVGHRANHAIPLPKCLDLPEAILPFDPYLLGLWLGDGATDGGTFTGMDPQLWEAFEAAGYKVRHFAKYSHYVYNLLPDLRAVGILGNKHVPAIYLRASKEQRLALLRGLMDTDGCVDEGGKCEFTNTNKQLAESLVQLILSLGDKAALCEGRATLYGKDCGPKYRVTWTASECPFLLPRKQARWKSSVRRTTRFRYIVKAEPIESRPGRCIQVDSPSHLYLASKSMIPTHNSRILRWACIYWLIRWYKDYSKKGIVAGLFCETFRDLEDRQIGKAREEFPEWLGHWSGYDFILSDELGGGMICFRNLDDPTKYRSVEYALISVDEITLSRPETFEYLVFSRLRWPGIERTKFMAATNPGGISHLYFKRLWIDRDFPERMSHLKEQFKYVRALPTDNPYNTQSYFQKLKALEPNLRRALLEGDWNAFTGQVFGEFRTDIHVIEPFKIPPWWNRWCANDPGFNDPGVWLWFAVNEDGRVFIYREATFSEEECGEKVPYSQQARKVKELTDQENIMWTVTGMDAYHRDSAHGTGKSIVDYYQHGGLSGFRKPIHGPGSVMRRVGVTHEYLRPYANHEGKKIAKLAIFNTCTKLISTLPSIPHDKVLVEEVDRACPYLHHFDCASYGICAWHISGSAPTPTSKIIPGSLGDILGHDKILNPPKESKNPFTFGKVVKS